MVKIYIFILGFVSFLNSLLSWFGGLVGAPYISFEYILGIGRIRGAVPCGILWVNQYYIIKHTNIFSIMGKSSRGDIKGVGVFFTGSQIQTLF